jgi:Family of unknown function (DUF5947)
VVNAVKSVKAHLERYLSPTSSSPAGSKESVFRTFRRFNRTRPAQKRCELCDIGLQEDHRHLLEISNGRIVCACDACALRFQAADEGRFKLIPRSIRSLPELDFNDGAWESLALPINLAFFLRSSAEGKIKAIYPSPGLIRMHWRGLAGGEVVWSEIDRFFARLQAASRTV